MTMSSANSESRVDGAKSRDVRLLFAKDGAHDFDELVGDVVEHELFGFAFGHLAHEILAKRSLMGTDGHRGQIQEFANSGGTKVT